MSEQQQSSSEKTEEATPKRLQDARKKGQVAKSAEVVMTISGAAVLATVCISLPYIKMWMEALYQVIFRMIPEEKDPTVSCLHLAVNVLCFAIAPIALTTVVSVIFANVAQFGFLFTGTPIKPEISKINPIQGLKRIFSMKTLFEFVKSVIKIVVLGIAVIWAILLFIKQLVYLPFKGVDGLMSATSHIFLFFCAIILSIWVLLSIADFLMQKHLHAKQLRMTKDETKRENKETEGNPEIKQTRKGIHREIIFDDSAAATRKSTVVVTNPTHYAVALFYAKGQTPLPVLYAKGKGIRALRMIAVAYEEEIPVIENVALARALYNKMQILDVVPYELLEPVAEIIRWVLMLPTRKDSA